MQIIAVCRQAAEGIEAGMAKWKYFGTPETGGGWVLQGCNCPGQCTESPAEAGRPNEERVVNCITCPPPDPGGMPTNPGLDDPPTNPRPPDKTNKKK